MFRIVSFAAEPEVVVLCDKVDDTWSSTNEEKIFVLSDWRKKLKLLFRIFDGVLDNTIVNVSSLLPSLCLFRGRTIIYSWLWLDFFLCVFFSGDWERFHRWLTLLCPEEYRQWNRKDNASARDRLFFCLAQGWVPAKQWKDGSDVLSQF